MIALLVGVAALLPWVVERVVGRLGAGKVAWQLAVRRLQLDPGGPARAVSGITVAVAGAIALQMVFTGVQDEFKQDTGADLGRASLYRRARRTARVAASTAASRARCRRRRPLRRAALAQYDVGRDPERAELDADRRAVRDAARGRGRRRRCTDGDVFFTRDGAVAGRSRSARRPGPSQRRAREIPTRADPSGLERGGVFATPAAVRGVELPAPYVSVFVRTDPARPDARGARPQRRGRARPALADPGAPRARAPTRSSPSCAARCWSARRSCIGLIGFSLLLTALEQLRERRRLLAVLVAFGTRRSTLSWSVLWQSAVPVALGLGDRGADRDRARRRAAARSSAPACRSPGSTSRRWPAWARPSCCWSPPRACRCCGGRCDRRDCGRSSFRSSSVPILRGEGP